MAFTHSQTIADTFNRTVLKRVNSANAETANLFVNCASLNCAISTLNLTSGANNFKIGETVTAAAGGTGIVQEYINATAFNLINVTGSFGNNNVITGGTTTKTRVQSGDIVAGTKVITISKLVYNIGGPLESKLQLDWEGSGASNHRAIAVLSGSGTLEFDTLASRVLNDAVGATGNILVTTINWNTNTHYTLVADIGKSSGFSTPYTEQNNHLGY